MQMVFDKLYTDSLAGCEFRNLINIITTEENIKLAYRNLKKNKGSRTPGTDGKTIYDLAELSETELIRIVHKNSSGISPNLLEERKFLKEMEKQDH